MDISCYAKFAEAVVTFVGDNSVLHRLIAGVAASKEIIVGLCVLALGEDQLHIGTDVRSSFISQCLHTSAVGSLVDGKYEVVLWFHIRFVIWNKNQFLQWPKWWINNLSFYEIRSIS